MVILAPSNRVLIVASMKNLPPKKSLSGVLIGGSRSLLTSYEGHGQKLGCPQIADRNIFKDGNEGFKNPGEDLEVLRSSCNYQSGDRGAVLPGTSFYNRDLLLVPWVSCYMRRISQLFKINSSINLTTVSLLTQIITNQSINSAVMGGPRNPNTFPKSMNL